MTSDAFGHVLDVTKARQSGATWMAQCLAHDDRTPSLAISEGANGSVLLHCHAGCPHDAVLDAFGLKPADLFDKPRTPTANGRILLNTYRYTNEAGTLLYEVQRYEGKEFRQRRPDGNGGWIYRLDDVRRPLYRLPEVLAAVQAGARIFLCEGEKDADRLVAEGEVATCISGGALKNTDRWQAEWSDALRDAHVVVVADDDAPGHRHARIVHDQLDGIAASLGYRSAQGR